MIAVIRIFLGRFAALVLPPFDCRFPLVQPFHCRCWTALEHLQAGVGTMYVVSTRVCYLDDLHERETKLHCLLGSA